MALYKVTVKRSGTVKGVRLEKGMTVDVVSQQDPVGGNGGQAAVDAFQRVYGIDLKQAGAANRGWLDVTKVN